MHGFDKDIEKDMPVSDTEQVLDVQAEPNASEDGVFNEDIKKTDTAENGYATGGESECVPISPITTQATEAEKNRVCEVYRRRGWVVLTVIAAICALMGGILIGSRFLAETPRDRVAIACHSVVLIEVKNDESKGIGSGIILTADGYIATNYHVVEEATSTSIIFTDGTSAEAKVVAYSLYDDLALLKVERSGLQAAVFASEQVCVGQSVYAIGHPGSALLSWTTTHGIISYVNRELPVYDEEGEVLGKRVLLQTDTPVNPGNSGGVLLNERGEVVGIITSRAETMANAELGDKDEATYRGLGFALPADKALSILKVMMRDGHADHVVSEIFFFRPEIDMTYGFVTEGVRYRVVNGELTFGKGDVAPKSGIYVIDPLGTSLQIGDIITHLDGYRLEEEDLYETMLLAYRPGDTVTLTVYRDGVTVEIRAVLQ